MFCEEEQIQSCKKGCSLFLVNNSTTSTKEKMERIDSDFDNNKDLCACGKLFFALG